MKLAFKEIPSRDNVKRPNKTYLSYSIPILYSIGRASVIIQQRYPDPRGGTITLVVVEDKPQSEFKIEIKKEESVAAPESKKKKNWLLLKTTNVFKTSENKTEQSIAPESTKVLAPLESKTEEEYKPKVDRFFCICRRRRFNRPFSNYLINK